MPNRNEKNKRKELVRQWSLVQNEKFLKSLPMPKEKFLELFDYMDENITVEDDDLPSFRWTEKFLTAHSIDRLQVINWCLQNGGGSDSEILWNIEDAFQLTKFSNTNSV